MVSLHDIVTDYIKKANDKELAGKIGSEILEWSRDVVKKYLFTKEDACMFHVAGLYRIVSRELLGWNKILQRRMKPTTSLAHPWQVRFCRNIPVEVFNLLKLTIFNGDYGIVVKSTKSVEQLQITTSNAAIKWITRVTKSTTSTLKETDIFFKLLRDGASYCKAIISSDHPFLVKYSKTQETVTVLIRYGHWNVFGVPQHVFSVKL